MEREGEVTTGFVWVRMRTVPSRRAFRYFAWPSKSIPLLVVAVGRGAGRGRSQSQNLLTELINGRQLPAGTIQTLRSFNALLPDASVGNGRNADASTL